MHLVSRSRDIGEPCGRGLWQSFLQGLEHRHESQQVARVLSRDGPPAACPRKRDDAWSEPSNHCSDIARGKSVHFSRTCGNIHNIKNGEGKTFRI